MPRFLQIAIAILFSLAVPVLSSAQVSSAEFDRTNYELEYHIFTNSQGSLVKNLEDLGINEQSEITAFDVKKTDSGVLAEPRASKLSQIKKWSIKNEKGVTASYCVMRFIFNSGATGWILYHFYDLTYLHPLALVAGAAMGGALSLSLMAYTLQIDHWIDKSRLLAGQFARYIFISIIYMASIKVAYLSTEMMISGASVLNQQILQAELLAMLKGLTGSAAQMFFTFWNFNRTKNRTAAITASSLSESEKANEHRFQKLLSRTNSFLNSIVNNTVSLMMNATDVLAVDIFGYGLILGGGGLFVKEYRSRTARTKSCSFRLQGGASF